MVDAVEVVVAGIEIVAGAATVGEAGADPARQSVEAVLGQQRGAVLPHIGQPPQRVVIVGDVPANRALEFQILIKHINKITKSLSHVFNIWIPPLCTS